MDASEYRAFAEHVHVMDVNGPPAEGYYKWLKELVLDQANSSEAEVIRLDQVTCDLSPGDGRWRWVTRETILHKFELWSAGGANWGPTIQLCGSAPYSICIGHQRSGSLHCYMQWCFLAKHGETISTQRDVILEYSRSLRDENRPHQV